MKLIAPTVLLLGLFVVTDPASGQLFRRMVRSRPVARRQCCPCPAGIRTSEPVIATRGALSTPERANFVPQIPTVHSDFTPAGPVAATEYLSPRDAIAPMAAAPNKISDGETVASPSDIVATDNIKVDKEKSWKSLFDGKTLGDWEPTRFGGEGEVTVEDGQIVCDFGQYISGVTYKGKDLPQNNYEIELEAMRVDGSDFFCGLTFPVDDSHATFVVGGWGGSVTGISNIDDYDASENDTTDYMQFKNKKWYKIRVRVTKGVLEAWIDDKKMVSKDVDASRLSTRIEVDPSKPLGIACFDTQAAYRNIRIRPETNPDSKTKN